MGREKSGEGGGGEQSKKQRWPHAPPSRSKSGAENEQEPHLPAEAVTAAQGAEPTDLHSPPAPEEGRGNPAPSALRLSRSLGAPLPASHASPAPSSQGEEKAPDAESRAQPANRRNSLPATCAERSLPAFLRLVPAHRLPHSDSKLKFPGRGRQPHPSPKLPPPGTTPPWRLQANQRHGTALDSTYVLLGFFSQARQS